MYCRFFEAVFFAVLLLILRLRSDILQYYEYDLESNVLLLCLHIEMHNFHPDTLLQTLE